jgi:Tfp pilus assembly protein PilO
MPSSFNLETLRKGLPVSWKKEPRMIARAALGVLLAANLVTALIALKPWAGSAEDLERQAAGLRQDIKARQASLQKLRTVVDKVRTARSEGDQFEDRYFMGLRTASSSIESELNQAAQQSGLKQKERVFSDEPIEGSDTLWVKTVNANFEGTFADLMHFINSIDRSPRFLILEYLSASPQQSGLALNVTMKLIGFVREGGAPDVPAKAAAKPQEQARLTQ